MIISFVNQKGGGGKTTAAVNLGSGLARKYPPLVLVDLDPQGRAAQWHAVEGNLAFSLKHRSSVTTPADIKEMSALFEYVIIDSPSAIDEATMNVMAVSDLVVIPVSPDSLDLWACTDTLKMIKKVQQKNPILKAGFLITQIDPDTNAGKELREALKAFEISIFNTELCQRTAYVEAMKNGVSVIQISPTGQAAAEIEQLCHELTDGFEKTETTEEQDLTTITALYRDDSDNHLFHDYQAL